MSKKLRAAQEKQTVVRCGSSLLKERLHSAACSGDTTSQLLHDAMDYERGGVVQLLALFRSLLHQRTSPPPETAVLVISAAINVVEVKQLRQISIKIIKALGKANPSALITVLLDRDLSPASALLHTCLYCAECLMCVHASQLVPFWEAQFVGEGKDYSELMLLCRAFNAYLTRLERAGSEKIKMGEVLDRAVLDLALDGTLNHDCRQLLGLVRFSLRYLKDQDHHTTYTSLYNESLAFGSGQHIEYYRFTLTSAVCSKLREVKWKREEVLRQALHSILDLAKRGDLDKLFAMTLFKCLSQLLTGITAAAREASLHQYIEEEEEEEKESGLGAERAVFGTGDTTARLFQLVQMHWSNKLEAVRRSVSEIHGSLIHILTLLVGDQSEAFLHAQVEGLLSLSWSVHGKYQALSQLVPIVGTSTLLKLQPRIAVSILETLSEQQAVANQCASLFVSLYKHDTLETSHETWLRPLSRYLSCPFIGDLCLRPILELDAGALCFLRDILNEEDKTHDMIRVMREGRRQGLLDAKFVDEPELFTESDGTLFGVPLDKIKILCGSNDDDKVLNVLGFICETNKTALPMKTDELDLVQHILRTNQTRQVPAFRKTMFDALEKFLTRLHLSCPILTRLSRNRHAEDDIMVAEHALLVLDNYNSFVSEVLANCFWQLIPSASFQRQVTVIGVIERVLQFLSVEYVPALASLTGCYLEKLLCSFQSTFESVRSSAMACVCWLGDIPIATLRECTSKIFRNLFSPKGVASQINMSLFEFVLRKSDGIPLTELLSDTEMEGMEFDVTDGWCRFLFSVLDQQIAHAKEDLVRASKENPIFPSLCLIEVLLFRGFLVESARREVVERLLELSVVLEELLHEPIVDDSPEGMLLLGSSKDGDRCGPQLLMSLTWRTMQSLCNCLVCLVSDSGEEGGRSLTTDAEEERVGEYLRGLLLTVRHHGVFENVHSAFTAYCAVMWTRRRELVVGWLTDILQRISTSSSDDMSYTRRSAGIPSLVQAILVTDPSRNNKPKLRETIEVLLSLTEEDSTTTAGGDTPLTARIHALHVLHTLFLDSKLADYVVPYIGRAFEVSIRGFAATHWSLRNSSTMLFAILMVRMFNNRHNNTRQTTDVTFFNVAPNLHPYFRGELGRAVAGEEGGEGSPVQHSLYHPTLYPILLVLQRLSPCALNPGDPALSVTCFVEPVTRFAGSGVEKTRKLAAETIASILAPGQVRQFLVDRLEGLVKGEVAQNCIQGTLHQVRALLPRLVEHGVPDEEVVGRVLGRSWLLTENPCPFTALTYVELLSDLVALGVAEFGELPAAALSVVTGPTPGHGPRSCLRDGCVSFLLALRSGPLVRCLLEMGDAAVSRRVLESPDIAEWLSFSTEDGRELRNLGLTASLQLIKAGVLSDEGVVYEAALATLQGSSSVTRQQEALQLLQNVKSIPDTKELLKILERYCSPLSSWEIRLLLPKCLDNVLSLLHEGDSEMQSGALWCLVNLLQDDDDGVRREAAAVILRFANYPHIDTVPELVLPILFHHLLSAPSSVGSWRAHLLDWSERCDVQELLTSSSTPRGSEHYGRNSTTTTTAHPLFEPDVINPYAEPLLIPRALEQCLAERREGTGTVTVNTTTLPEVPEVLDGKELADVTGQCNGSELRRSVVTEKCAIIRRCRRALQG